MPRTFHNPDPMKPVQTTYLFPQTSRDTKGFTLIELLVVIAVLGILAGIIYTVSQKVYLSSQKAVATSNLRQVGAAMQLYVQDRGSLPGPLWRAQTPYYNRDDRSLAHNLAEYVDLPKPDSVRREFPLLSCPLFEEIRPADNTPGYIICDRATMMDGGKLDPWGYRKDGADEFTSPQSGIAFLSAVTMDSWVLRAFDQGVNPNPDAGWSDRLLDEPLFPGGRLHLFFDWRVEFVPIN